MLLLLAGLTVYAAIPHERAQDRLSKTPDDSLIYGAILKRVEEGQNYYLAAAAEHRRWHAPLRPAQAFREPTLAWTLALLKTDAFRRLAMTGLLAATAIAMRRALDRTTIDPRLRTPGLLLQLTGLCIAAFPLSPLYHDIWAALLIALSLALYRPDRYAAAIVVGVAACLFRELALPYLGAMAAFALYERRWRELAGWCGGILVFLGLYAIHLVIAGRLYQPGDLISPGWLFFGGWDFVVEACRRNLALHLLPPWVAALAACLGLVGLAGWRDPWVSRVALVVGGYMGAFLVVGRPDTSYWGQLYAPLLPLGLVLAPAALADLWRQARPARRAPSLQGA